MVLIINILERVCQELFLKKYLTLDYFYVYNLFVTRKQLQRLIIQKGFTQTELAKKVGMPYPQILCSMLRGDRWAKGYRSHIAKILGIDESELPQPSPRKI